MRGKHIEKNKKATEGRFMKLAVVFILLQVFGYVWAHLILSYKAGIEIAPVVSCAFLGFCGAEAGLLAMIKKSKINKINKESGEINNEQAY